MPLCDPQAVAALAASGVGSTITLTIGNQLTNDGTVILVVTERMHEPWDLGVFESVGIDPRRARFPPLKSRMNCRPVFVPIAAALVECDGRGVTSSDYVQLRARDAAGLSIGPGHRMAATN
ncbi:microcystin degradation protein MlrC [Paraburkholderia sp. WC7.3g]